jgi:hypothetical protein
MTTLAAIDRVVHHSVILDMMGVDSYRVKEANQQHGPPSEERREDSNGSTSSAKVMRIQSTI